MHTLILCDRYDYRWCGDEKTEVCEHTAEEEGRGPADAKA